MAPEALREPLRTPRLELVPLAAGFVEAVVEGDARAAAREIGATVGRWLTLDPSHIVQLHLAAQAAEARGFPGLGRSIVHGATGRPRRVLGSIGFHGPPDERGRLEASCRIHPTHQGQGFASEALGALLDWAAVRYGVTRFLVAVPSRQDHVPPIPVDIGFGRNQASDMQVDQIAGLLEPYGHPR
jgi:RimJ/RimL family protein N-acetyltransferase